MTSAIRHRGPDDADHWRDGELPVALGHRRLSIIDLRPEGRQPMASPEGDLRLVFNGEIYNYLELRSELRDHPYRTRTDSEVILAAYRAWGEACVERFIGMFAFALWDARRRLLFCARDRLGSALGRAVHAVPLGLPATGDGGARDAPPPRHRQRDAFRREPQRRPRDRRARLARRGGSQGDGLSDSARHGRDRLFRVRA